MPWAVVRGMYERGIVKPLEGVPYREGMEVLVLFPERIRPTGTGEIWQQIKKEIAREMPDLLSMTKNERQAEFDRLSNVIADHIPYRSLEEFERAMRGRWAYSGSARVQQSRREVRCQYLLGASRSAAQREH